MSARLGRLLFRARGWTPVPLVAALLILARPSPVSFAAGVAVAAAGEALRLAALRHLDSTSRGARFRATALATGGPFRFVRHPVYLGNALIVCGLCFAAGVREPWFWVLAAAAFVVQYAAIISGEEAFLAGTFPAAFATYCTRVPRLVPRIVPRLGAGRPAQAEPMAARRALGEVFRDEHRTLQTLFLLLVLLGLKGLVLRAS